MRLLLPMGSDTRGWTMAAAAHASLTGVGNWGAPGPAFLLFVGLLPAALAAVMIPFLNYVPFEEAAVRSCFTSGVAPAAYCVLLLSNHHM